MLLRSQLEEMAETFTGGNVGHLETLYLQDIALHSISGNTAGELVFNGGTALLKFYNLDRLSKDLDFTAAGRIDVEDLISSIGRQLESFGAELDKVEGEEGGQSMNQRLGIRGPLFTGIERSLCFIRVEINKRAEAVKPVLKRYTPNFPDIPAFDLHVLAEEEILAEKIRALVTRSRPRDLYDIYHLLSKGVEIDSPLVEKKLSYYDLELEPEALLENAKRARKGWAELKSLTYSQLPDFERVLDVFDSGSRKVR